MTRPWNPNRRLSEADYRALSPAERRALYRAREQARSEWVVEIAHGRALEKHNRRFGHYRPRTGKAEPWSWMSLIGLVPIAFVATWNYAPSSWFEHPAVSASGKASVRTEFIDCKWGGGTNCVVDGDTFYLEGQKIRIAGIDAPETHDYGCDSELALGDRATARLKALLNSGAVSLTAIDRDEDVYGRKLRNAAVGGRDVGDVLIGEGLARAYAGGRRSWCE